MKKEKVPFLSTEWFKQQFESTHNLEYNIVPDNIIRWEGLIAPNGDFFSCEFGGHLAKAHYLILKYPTRFGLPPDLNFETKLKLCGDMSLSLDYLIQHGWCATRYMAHIGHYITAPIHMTHAQINTLYDAIIKHNVNMDISQYINSY